jgi:choline dehydrogenase-like flavoprotein
MGEGKVLNIPFLDDAIVSYNINNKEVNTVKKGLEKLCKLMIDAGCEYIYPICKKSLKLNKDNYINYINKIKKITDLNYSTVHILGGIPMGENNNTCLVDSYGKLNKSENFYINDSSLICNKLLKNPQGTVMAIALRNVSNFLSKNK